MFIGFCVHINSKEKLVPRNSLKMYWKNEKILEKSGKFDSQKKWEP